MTQEQRENQERRSHWEALINEWQTSGLTISKFCRQRELKQHQFKYWQYQLKPKRLNTLPISDPIPQFIEVKPCHSNTMNEAVLEQDTMEIRTQFGFSITLKGELNTSQLTQLFVTLKGLL